MKLYIYRPFIILLLTFTLIRCSKNPDEETVVDQKMKLVKIRQGVDPATDTVYLISYNNENKITAITDSTYGESLTATYNAQGYLTSITAPYDFNAAYTYNADGLLTEVNAQLFQEHDRFVITYINGVVDEKKWYTSFGAGETPYLAQTSKYTVTDGNVTNIKQYRPDGSLATSTDFEYDLEPNPFKELSLFNYYNVLGADPIFNPDTYFNKSILHSLKTNGYEYSNTNLYNNEVDSDNLLSIEVFFLPKSSLEPSFLTWHFFYR